jgi:hypothetical protein
MSKIALEGNSLGTGTTTLKTKNTNTSTTFELPDVDGTNGQALITNGSGSLSFGPAGNYVMTAYTSPGTWTKPASLKAVKVTVVGAGGNGGNGTDFNGGNGGGGGAAIKYLSAPDIPGPVSVTVGTAPSKTSSFGPFLSATGGTNGANAPPTANAPLGPYAGGAGSGGNINVSGGAAYGLGSTPGGSAGGSGFGFGQPIQGPASGTSGLLYGGGGLGRIQAGAGGTGAAGIVIVEEFY